MHNPSTPERPQQPRTLVRAISLTFAGQGGLFITGAIISVLSARLLGTGGKGEMATAVIAAGVLGLLTELGLRAAIIRTVASGRASWKEGLATMLLLYGAVCVLILPLALLFFGTFHDRLFPHLPLHVLYIAMIGIPIGLLEGSLTSALIGHQRMPEVAGIWVLEKLGIVCGFLALVWLLGYGVAGAIIAQLAGVTMGIAAALGMLSRLPGGELRVRTDLIPDLLRTGSVWYTRNLATSLNYRLDALLVFAFLGKSPAGLYAVAVALAELLQYLPNSIDSVLFPSVSSGESIPIEKRTARLSRLTVFVSLVGGIFLALLGYPILLLLFGESFTAGLPALLLLLPGMLVLGQSKVISSEMLGRGYAKYPAIASWVALLGTLALDFLLIPRLGIAGAAIASTVAYSISAVVNLCYYQRLTGVAPGELYALRREEISYIAGRLLRFARR